MRSEIFCENVDYLHLYLRWRAWLFQDVLIFFKGYASRINSIGRFVSWARCLDFTSLVRCVTLWHHMIQMQMWNISRASLLSVLHVVYATIWFSFIQDTQRPRKPKLGVKITKSKRDKRKGHYMKWKTTDLLPRKMSQEAMTLTHFNWLITLKRVMEFHLKIVFVDNSRAFQDFDFFFLWKTKVD